jgi:erythromycin esterase-like protein
MWRNREVAELLAPLRDHNAELAYERRCGFYGLDLYNLRSSMTEVLAYLDQTDPEAAKEARRATAAWRPGPTSRRSTGGRR